MRLLVFPILFFVFLSVSAIEFDLKPVTESDVALLVYDLETDKEVVSINPDKDLHYASNLKLLTTATALHNLGGGFRFFTLFSFDPADGTLYIKATGNPEMVIEKMWRLASDLKRKGFENIKKVVVDDFLYGEKGAYAIPKAGSGDNAYLAPIAPLSLNFNSCEIYVASAEVGSPVKVQVTTPGGHFLISNTAKTVKGGGNGLIVGTMPKNGKTVVIVKGTLGAARRKPVIVYKKVWNPTNHYVATLLDLLGNKEVPIKRKKLNSSIFSTKKNINYINKSSPLRDILKVMNRFSSNFMAESIQFFMGAILRGDKAQGVELLKEYALNQLGETVDIVNGSGLGNAYNKLSARFFVKLLKNMYKNGYDSIDFFSTMPVMGEDGTLKKASKDDGCVGFIRGKTGSLTGVAALSGIMKTKSGKVFLYSFTVNNFPSKRFKPMWNFRDKIMQKIWKEF